MKKFLLSVAVLFTALTASAQKTTATVELANAPQKTTVTNFNVERIATTTFKNVALKAPKAAPTGDVKKYFLDQAEYVYVLSDTEQGLSLLPRYHAATELITSADGFTYMRMPIGENIFKDVPYIKGKLSADGNTFTIQQQSIGTVQEGMYNFEFFFSSINTNDGSESADPIVFTKNADGVIALKEGAMFGVFVHNGSQSSLNTLATGTMLTTPDMYPAATTHEYEYTSLVEQKKMTGSLEIIEAGNNCLIKGFVNGNNGWFMGQIDNQRNITIPNFQISTSDVFMAFLDASTSQIGNAEGVKFTYNSANDTYTMANNTGVANCIYSQDDKGEIKLYIYDDGAVNPTFKGKGTTGIGSVTTENGEVVATEYFDLSGRRINGAQNGVSVKVMKYADGTSKAVKVIK